MKRVLTLTGLFLGAACAGGPEVRSDGAGAGLDGAEPVRLETRAGSFLVNPNQAEALRQLLAGEAPENHGRFYADVDRGSGAAQAPGDR